MKKNLIRSIVSQVVILVIAYLIMTPDVLEDNTHVFGLIGSYDLVRGNTIWVMIGALVATIINVWFWWPREVVNTPSDTPATTEGTKSAEAGEEIDQDPKTPDLN